MNILKTIEEKETLINKGEEGKEQQKLVTPIKELD